jgi:hypothetical protein
LSLVDEQNSTGLYASICRDTALPCPYRALLIIGIRLRIVAIVFKLKTISDLVNLLKSFKQLFSVTFVPIASTAPAEPGLQCK